MPAKGDHFVGRDPLHEGSCHGASVHEGRAWRGALGAPLVVVGTGTEGLGSAIADQLSVELRCGVVRRFPDGEVQVDVGSVRDHEVWLVQSTGPPVDEHVVELLMVADACRRGGAAKVSAVVPYFGYARQDRRSVPGEALGVRVMADLMASAGVDRLLVLDPHTEAMEALCPVPAEIVSAVPALVSAVRAHVSPDAVVVAPDEGAIKLAERYGAELGLGVALVRKRRLSGEEVRAGEVVGQVSGRPVLLVDDMISTGATLAAAVRAVLEHGALGDVVVAASHGLFVGPAGERLGSVPVRRLVVTDSLVSATASPWPTTVVGAGPLLAARLAQLWGKTSAASGEGASGEGASARTRH